MIQFSCWVCHEGMEAPESLEGEPLACPNCGAQVKVPAAGIIALEEKDPSAMPVVFDAAEVRVHRAAEEKAVPAKKSGFFDAWVYPLKGQGKFLLLGYLVAIVVVGFIVRFMQFVPIIGGVVGMVLGLILGLYVQAYGLKVVSSSAAGEPEPPDWPDLTNLWEDLIHPSLMFAWVLAVCFGPAVVYHFYWEAGLADPWLRGLLIFGFIYFPMALLAVVVRDSFLALQPLVVLPAIIKVLDGYIFVEAVLVAVAGSFYFLGKIHLPSSYLRSVVSLYLAMVALRAIGLIYFKYAKRLKWY